jgi:hypothetical protein
LQNTKGIGEGKAKAVAKETGAGSSVVQELGHQVVRVEDETRGSITLGADAGNNEGLGEGRRCNGKCSRGWARQCGGER